MIPSSHPPSHLFVRDPVTYFPALGNREKVDDHLPPEPSHLRECSMTRQTRPSFLSSEKPNPDLKPKDVVREVRDERAQDDDTVAVAEPTSAGPSSSPPSPEQTNTDPVEV